MAYFWLQIVQYGLTAPAWQSVPRPIRSGPHSRIGGENVHLMATNTVRVRSHPGTNASVAVADAMISVQTHW